ncbi:unnamed protein product [[Actinomadura] parvosata subsp. kistnae]|uniref:Uncharacterized protein n=1 Tax=[Actinomadura] parvosata subsp. kistnae TaxID=1909395 RepID=A0A1U9ZV03_9ACTN|nr:hypothetical protein [Nonomuraea sp. ATCC 55076]AQZ61770.1 hypothetical protein BKM31_10040 [Nonomuraea sp. ATCC 55076]SPL87888.1 unnamed protein product [Actinomadura parvosata subsp. kistnae]
MQVTLTADRTLRAVRLAFGHSARFLRVNDSGQVDVTTYTFAREQYFMAATSPRRAPGPPPRAAGRRLPASETVNP